MDEGLAILGILTFIFLLYCWKRVYEKLGYDNPGLMGFLMLIPFINLILFFAIIVFSKYPIQTRVEELEKEIEEFTNKGVKE